MLNVPMVHCAILIDRSQKSRFPFSKHLRRQGTRQSHKGRFAERASPIEMSIVARGEE